MSTEFDHKADLKQLIDRLTIKDVRCVALNANLVNERGIAPTSVEFNFSDVAEYRHEANIFGCRISGTAKFTNGSELIAQVETKFLVIHELSEGSDISPEVIQAYIEHNALFIAYPYFREIIHGTAARLGLGNLVLNIMKRA